MTIMRYRTQVLGFTGSVIDGGMKNNACRASFGGDSCGNTAKKSSSLLFS